MRKHLTEVHNHEFNLKEGMYACEQCDKKFRTFDILTKHIKVNKYYILNNVYNLYSLFQGVHEAVHVPCYICAKLVKEGTPMEHHIK